MSAKSRTGKNRPVTTDETTDDDYLPADIDAEAFCELHDADTVREAKRRAAGLDGLVDTEEIDPDELGADDTDHDPYDIVPEGFCDAWGAETIPEALTIAEDAPSTTLASDRIYCPDCGSVRVSDKPGYTVRQRKDPDYVCTSCRNHFDTPVTQTAFGREF